MGNRSRNGPLSGGKEAGLALLLAGAIAIIWTSVPADASPKQELALSKCAKTPYPGKQNYFQETAECSTPRNWTLVVQAENGTLGRSCIGPNDQSFLINAPGSPVTLGWIRHDRNGGQKWTVNLKVNTAAHTACQNQYTFFGFMNHIEHGGGLLPNLSNLQSVHELSYEQFALAGGEVRLTLGAQIFWNGKAHILELLPARIGYKANPGFPLGGGIL